MLSIMLDGRQMENAGLKLVPCQTQGTGDRGQWFRPCVGVRVAFRFPFCFVFVVVSDYCVCVCGARFEPRASPMPGNALNYTLNPSSLTF